MGSWKKVSEKKLVRMRHESLACNSILSLVVLHLLNFELVPSHEIPDVSRQSVIQSENGSLLMRPEDAFWWDSRYFAHHIGRHKHKRHFSRHHRHFHLEPMDFQSKDFLVSSVVEETATVPEGNPPLWPVKKEAVVEGQVILGGLMMVHEREDNVTCGKIMPQGGIQALEAMLYTVDRVNQMKLLPNFTLGAHILDDCDKDTYGLEMALDFIKGKFPLIKQKINILFNVNQMFEFYYNVSLF